MPELPCCCERQSRPYCTAAHVVAVSVVRLVPACALALTPAGLLVAAGHASMSELAARGRYHEVSCVVLASRSLTLPP